MTGSPPSTEGAQAEAQPLVVYPVTGLPDINAGDDLAGLLVAALDEAGLPPLPGDVLVVSSKVVSKALGLREDVGGRAGLVLRESRGVLAERRGARGLTRVVRTIAGPVLAGAGIDASNTGAPEGLLLLPHDPDEQARRLREGILRRLADAGSEPDPFAVIVTDTAGRPWRQGLTDFALGVCGMPALEDLRGGRDADGRPLSVSMRALADELACAADLVKGKARGVPAALVRGLTYDVPPRARPDRSGPASPAAGAGRDGAAGAAHGGAAGAAHGGAAGAAHGGAAGAAHHGGGASDLLREGYSDWFALGHVEAVRAALGVDPATPAALDVGLPGLDPDPIEERLARAARLARVDGLGIVPPGHPRARLVGHRPAVSSATIDVVQFGALVEAPDELTLGAVAARLLVALAAEGIDAAWARTEAAGPGHGPRALVLITSVAGDDA